MFKQIRTPNIFGFTGTMPEEIVDQWNIIGKIGPIIYKKGSYDLRQDNYISDVKVQILQLEYATQPVYPRELKDPSDRYRAELDFLSHNNYRNGIITQLCKKVDNNALVLVDYIEHGNTLHRFISDRCKDKRVYFIRGEVDVEDRDKVKRLMEEEDNIVVVAISKIFSTGINIKNLRQLSYENKQKKPKTQVKKFAKG